MSGQSAGTCKPFFTNLTSKGFLSGVGAVMSGQIDGSCKPFVTDFAHKRWLASGVDALMFRQIAGSCKPFFTHHTHKWFLSCVNAEMPKFTGCRTATTTTTGFICKFNRVFFFVFSY